MDNSTIKALKEYVADTSYAMYAIEPWETVNKYFIANEDKNWNVALYLKVGKKKVSLWKHSTLDITNAHNFIRYTRVLCENLLNNKN